jgi:hypothetical protein
MTSVSTDRRQSVNAGRALKVPCRAATTANIALSGEQTIDGVACVTGDRVLVKNQTSSVNNGIYVVDTGTWSRAVDFDGTYDAGNGTLVEVNSGTVSARLVYVLTTADPITIGTTSLTFAVMAPSSPISLPLSLAQGGTSGDSAVKGLAGLGVVACTAVGGTANAITCTVDSTVTAYRTNQIFELTPASVNTGAATLTPTPSGAGALAGKSIFAEGSALVGGELKANVPVLLHYDGTRLNIIGASTTTVNVRQFGAKGDGSTDDSTAFQNAINVLGSSGGGDVIVPYSASPYQFNSGVTISGRGIRIIGQTAISPFIRTNTNGVTPFTITGSYCEIRNMQIGLPESNSGANTGSGILLSGAVSALIDNVLTTGGAAGIKLSGAWADCVLSKCTVYDIYGAVNAALIDVSGSASAGGGLYLLRNKLDQVWPVSTPTAAQIVGAWAGTTGYTQGQVVTSGGWYLQCKTAGTSAGGAPTISTYGTDINDGTVVWRMCCPATLTSILLDSNTFYVLGQWNDCTGALRYGIRVRNTLGGTIPEKIQLRENEIGSVIETGVLLDAVEGFTLTANTIDNAKTGNGVYLNGASVKGGVIANNIIYGNKSSGIELNLCTHVSLSNNEIVANVTAGIFVDANTTDFLIAGNYITGSIGTFASGTQATGIAVAAGTSNRYDISHNYVIGNTATINDGGSGTTKRVSRNLGYNPIAQTAITVTASPFTFTNNTGDDVDVFVIGGTVSQVTYNGNQVYTATGCVVRCRQDRSIGVTYTVAPTMNYLGA